MVRTSLRSGYALPTFQPLQQPNPHRRAKASRHVAFLHPKGVVFGREKGVTFGCDLTVGLYVGEDYGAFHVIGGNQSDGVTITRIARDRCIAVRRPVYKAAPATATPIHLAANGALSTNEA